MGVLGVGDQLPTVRDVVAATAVNPNTVLKAYWDLEREGLVQARRARHVRAEPRRGRRPARTPGLGRSLARWVLEAREAGLRR